MKATAFGADQEKQKKKQTMASHEKPKSKQHEKKNKELSGGKKVSMTQTLILNDAAKFL